MRAADRPRMTLVERVENLEVQLQELIIRHQKLAVDIVHELGL